jgi:hypothetical protein
MPKWIAFVEVPAPGVTKRWEIRATQGNLVIGLVSWSNGWRRYVLRPGYPTEWEQDCLRDVADFLEARTREHKASRLTSPSLPRHAEVAR